MGCKNLEEAIDSNRSSSFDDDFERLRSIATRPSLTFIFYLYIFCLLLQLGSAEVLPVYPDSGSLKGTIYSAKPGDIVSIHPGIYRGGIWIISIDGSESEPIYIQAADPSNLPVISGGSAGLQFSACSHLVIRDIVFDGQYENGVNIDDNGEYRKGDYFACKNITLERILVRNLKGVENNDGIKISGAIDFAVKDCTVEGWGVDGCGIDMVGCTNGKLIDCRFDGRSIGGWGIQAKGASRDIEVDRCFVYGVVHRGIQMGGITGTFSIRDPTSRWECERFSVRNSSIHGGDASIAIVNAHDTTVRNCRLLNPRMWFFRILIENKSSGFDGCRDGKFEENLFVCNGKGFLGAVDSNQGTSPGSFQFSSNIWCFESNLSLDLRYGLPNRDKDSYSGFHVPAAFLRSDVGFSDKHFDMLRELLIVEQDATKTRKRLVFIGMGSLGMLYVGILFFAGWYSRSSEDSQRCKVQQIRRSLCAVFAFMASFLLLFHFSARNSIDAYVSDLIPSNWFEYLSTESSVPSGTRFELLIGSCFLTSSIVCFGIAFRRWLRRLSNTLWGCLIIGTVSSSIVFFLERFLFGFPPSFCLLLDLSAGVFGGFFLFGFSRLINAAVLIHLRERFSLTDFHLTLWLSLGSIVFLSLWIHSVQFDVRFLYNRSRMLSLNLIPFSRHFDLAPVLPLLFFGVVLGFCMGRSVISTNVSTRITAWRYTTLFMLILGFEIVDFFRPGEYVELDRVLIAFVPSALMMYLEKRSVSKPAATEERIFSERYRWREALGFFAIYLGTCGLYALFALFGT